MGLKLPTYSKPYICCPTGAAMVPMQSVVACDTVQQFVPFNCFCPYANTHGTIYHEACSNDPLVATMQDR